MGGVDVDQSEGGKDDDEEATGSLSGAAFPACKKPTETPTSGS